MERLFQILAVILAGVAAYFFWSGNTERAFISAVLGAVSFFLSVRFQVKARMDQREFERLEEQRREEEELAGYAEDEASSDQLPGAREDEISDFTDDRRTADREKI